MPTIMDMANDIIDTNMLYFKNAIDSANTIIYVNIKHTFSIEILYFKVKKSPPYVYAIGIYYISFSIGSIIGLRLVLVYI